MRGYFAVFEIFDDSRRHVVIMIHANARGQRITAQTIMAECACAAGCAAFRTDRLRCVMQLASAAVANNIILEKHHPLTGWANRVIDKQKTSENPVKNIDD
jgi:hypothetical protein